MYTDGEGRVSDYLSHLPLPRPSMAEPTTASEHSYHPEPRCDAPSFTLGTQLYMTRGFLQSYQHHTEVVLPEEVEVFDGVRLSWEAVASGSQQPTWYQGAAVTTYQGKAFFLGGDCGATLGFCNQLFSLNAAHYIWREILFKNSEAMLRTTNAELVSIPNGDLLAAGGYAETPTSQSTTRFIPDPGNTRGLGYTDQLLYWNTESGNQHHCSHDAVCVQM